MSYKHLSQTERYQIYALTKAGHKPVETAKLLGRHRERIRLPHFVFHALGTYHAFTLILRVCVFGDNSSRTRST